MDLISIIILLGIVQGFFIGLYFLTKKGGNIRANRIIGILFITFSISIINFFILRTELHFKYPHLYGISFPVLFLFGPLFYFYVKLIINRNYKFKKNTWLHFLPFILCIIVMLPDYLLSIDEKRKIFVDYMISPLGVIISMAEIIHLFTYNAVIYKIVEKHKELIKLSESSIEGIDLHWVQNGIICFVGTFGLMLIFWILLALGINTINAFHLSIPLIVTFIIYAMGYLGLKQSDIPMVVEETIPVPSKKYEKSTLKDDQADEYTTKIKDFMGTQKPFLDNNLSLQKLADLLNIHTHHLSQIINENFNQNFFDFINSYRVEEAKKLLCDQQNNQYTVLAIAEESGFNSKTSFNSAFKKFTNMTPSEFKKKNLAV